MPDIAFLLIIFFIVLAVVSPRIGLPVFLEQDAKREAARLAKGEVVRLEGRGEATIQYRGEKRSMAWLRRFLRNAVDQQPDVAVDLRLADRFRYEGLVRVVAAVNESGIRHFRVDGLETAAAP